MYCKKVTRGIIENHIGEHIQLGGFGIINGLKGWPTKYGLYKIIGMEADFAILKGYRRKKRSLLPKTRFNQECVIWPKKEYKTLPIY